MMQLPRDFMIRMQDMLQEAYPAFLRSYEQNKYQALRVNTLKGTTDEFLNKVPFWGLTRVPWEARGFYYVQEDEKNLSETEPIQKSKAVDSEPLQDKLQPGKHPLHDAGVYYIQEPSAMVPAVYLEAKPGERILDLCAAPGGKTTQIAADMCQEGVLVCNEIHPTRAKILSENVERMGIRNALVTNETPQRLSEVFGAYFDRILVDAPCSGEGMFRKNQEACKEWSLENVQLCAKRQDEILDCADHMLRPGGRLVYSTCTFAPAENEGSIARFLERHPQYQVVQVPLSDKMAPGKPQWAYYGDVKQQNHALYQEDLMHTIRLFPHQINGEGHFIAVLQKQGDVPDAYQGFLANGVQKGICAKEAKEFIQFQQEMLAIDFLAGRENSLLRLGEQLYLMPEKMPSIDRLKVLRTGLHLGTLKKNRFEPSHALALTLKKDEAGQSMELETIECARAYLQGLTLNHSGEKGWYLMTYQGYSIGWGKLAGQIMKNHYPKGLRK